MNVTFMIGNGFDLRLGMKTRYTDMYDGYITDFKTFKTSDYLSDVYADARGTYLKFEVK